MRNKIIGEKDGFVIRQAREEVFMMDGNEYADVILMFILEDEWKGKKINDR